MSLERVREEAYDSAIKQTRREADVKELTFRPITESERTLETRFDEVYLEEARVAVRFQSKADEKPDPEEVDDSKEKRARFGPFGNTLESVEIGIIIGAVFVLAVLGYVSFKVWGASVLIAALMRWGGWTFTALVYPFLQKRFFGFLSKFGLRWAKRRYDKIVQDELDAEEERRKKKEVKRIKHVATA